MSVGHLYVLRNVFSLCSWDVCLCDGSQLKPEGHQPADEDDSGLKEALLGAVQCFTTILLPTHHTVVGLRTHRRYIYRDKAKSFIHAVTLIEHYFAMPFSELMDLDHL